MVKNILKILLVIAVLFSFNEAKSQVSVSYYGNTTYSKLGVAYDFSGELWTELRIYSGTSLAGITAEAALNYDFRNKEKYKTYVGGGVSINRINGIFGNLGIGFTPFEELSNFSLQLEFQPMYNFDYGGVILQGFWGIRYSF